MHETNQNQDIPVGFPVHNWQTRPVPPRSMMQGNDCRIEPLHPDVHGESLYQAYSVDSTNKGWVYLPYGPFTNRDDFTDWLRNNCMGDDPLFHAIVDTKTHHACGLASYLRIQPTVGVIEVGHIHFSPQIQGTRMATEAMFLMMSRVFDGLGYRRYEWKCDACNQASRNAALRLGFTFEGIFRQATIYKKRNRDTAWYSIIDTEWPKRRAGFEQWLHPNNFDGAGQQRRSLQECYP